MDRQALYAAWDRSGKDRPQWVRANRDDLAEYLSDSVTDALPSADASTFAFREFLNDYKGTITRQLDDDAGESDPHNDEVSA